MTDNQDDLIKDLERRAKESKGEAPSVDTGAEDIEAFLREHEGEDYKPPEDDDSGEKDVIEATIVPDNSKSASKDPKVVDSPIGSLEKPPGDPRTKRKQGSTVAKPVERGESRGLKVFLFLLKYSILLFPIAVSAWLLGAWLGSWVETGWLLAIIGILGIIVPGLIIYLIFRKGRIIWWMSGFALIAAVIFLAAFPNISAESIVRHGHWPLTAILNPMGVSPDNFATRGVDTVNEKIAGLLSKESMTVVPTQLGSAEPLIPAEGATAGEVQPTNGDAAATDGAAKTADPAKAAN